MLVTVSGLRTTAKQVALPTSGGGQASESRAKPIAGEPLAEAAEATTSAQASTESTNDQLVTLEPSQLGSTLIPP